MKQNNTNNTALVGLYFLLSQLVLIAFFAVMIRFIKPPEPPDVLEMQWKQWTFGANLPKEHQRDGKYFAIGAYPLLTKGNRHFDARSKKAETPTSIFYVGTAISQDKKFRATIRSVESYSSTQDNGYYEKNRSYKATRPVYIYVQDLKAKREADREFLIDYTFWKHHPPAGADGIAFINNATLLTCGGQKFSLVCWKVGKITTRNLGWSEDEDVITTIKSISPDRKTVTFHLYRPKRYNQDFVINHDIDVHLPTLKVGNPYNQQK